MRIRALAIATILSTALSASSVATSHAEVIERVVAVVNDDAILLSELRQKAAPFLARAMQAPTESQRTAAITEIYRQILGRMIDERLLLQAADDEDVTVSTSEVSSAIDNVRQQSGLDESEFWGAVRQQGFSEGQYRRDVRQQLLRLKVLNERVRGRVNITEEDVRRRYDEMAAQGRREATFEADYIRIPIWGSGATDLHTAMETAEALRTEIEAADSAAAAMHEHGSTSTGQISEHDLAAPLADALAQLEPGQVSAPVRHENAVYLFLLHDRDVVASDLAAYDAARTDIYRQMVQDAMARQEELFLEELRRRAVIVRRLEF